MPSAAQEIIEIYEEATRANYDDAWRRGAVVELPAAGDLIYSADLHGNRTNFDKLMQIANLRKHPRRHIVFQELTHGGPRTMSGGCLSFRLIEVLANMKCQYPQQVHMLMGNHELSEYLGTPIMKGNGMESLNDNFDQGLAEAYGVDKAIVVEAIHRFIESMPIAARTASGILMCHSVPPADVADWAVPILSKSNIAFELVKDSFIYKLVWGRSFDDENVDTLLKELDCSVMMVGHTSCPEGFRKVSEKLLIIDSQHEKGCYVYVDLATPPTMEALLANVRNILSPDEIFSWD